jgi:dihydroorotate dehydrogenase/NAD-dependent dihydropyrimidine dehydrogenase PreA subunit
MQHIGPQYQDYNNPEILDLLEEDIRVAHREGLAIIVSVLGRDLDSYQQMAIEIASLHPDALELNLTASADGIVDDREAKHLRVGQHFGATARVVEAVCDASEVPVTVKLMRHGVAPAVFAQLCQETGGAAVAATGSTVGLLGVDIETGIPHPQHVDGRAYLGWLTGPALKPIGLREVAEIALGTDIPVIAAGGIVDWKDAVEYAMVGATAFQLCTAVMWNGFDHGNRLAAGLRDFLKRQSHSSLVDLRGIALKYLKAQPTPPAPVVAVIDLEKCNACGRCLVSCQDTAYQAVDRKGNVYAVSPEKCVGCGLCRIVCSEEAITFQTSQIADVNC